MIGMAAITQSINLAESHLRPFDPHRDLNGVADLIEQCFAETLDTDGRRYIDQMRSAARYPTYLRWATLTNDNTSTPLMGFVWEEGGRVIGNLSLIPFRLERRRSYLIANVAVSPGYRRQGIARTLTNTALKHAQRLGAYSVWLHVRHENQAAIHLYESLGFKEQARRTTWENVDRVGTFSGGGEVPAGLSISQASSKDWSQIRSWLEQLYPPEIRWHLPYDASALRVDLWGSLYRFIMQIDMHLWVATYHQQCIGMLAWQPFQNQADFMWLACAPDNEDLVIRTLMPHLYLHLSSRRRLLLDFPDGHGVRALNEIGLHANQTLIWMSVDVSSSLLEIS
jgi:ribosomal protein S18 acetylase RimI-like enzyme